MQFINMWMAQNPEMTATILHERQKRLEINVGIELSKEFVCMLCKKLK